MTEAALNQDKPRRGRPPRAEAVATTRRRRHDGTITRMAQFKLDCIDPSMLDLDKYVYRWVNDEPGKLRMATKFDDYDHVETHELGKDFDVSATDSESDDRVRMYVGKDDHGNPVHAFLVKKLRDYWVDDNEAVVRKREDMMAGRVYRGETTDTDEDRPGGDDKFYIPSGTQLGHGGERRRGRIKN